MNEAFKEQVKNLEKQIEESLLKCSDPEVLQEAEAFCLFLAQSAATLRLYASVKIRQAKERLNAAKEAKKD